MSKVLVTGGTKGIGLAVVQHLRATGHEVFACARDERADIRCDVTLREDVDRMCSSLGTIDVLVNNVGGAVSAPFLKMDEAVWDDQIRLNLKSIYYCIQAFLPGMLAQKNGRIINVASTAGKIGYPYISAYAAAKHAVVGLTRSLAKEVAERGVTVNAVCPSFVDTPMLRDSVSKASARTGKTVDELLDVFRNQNPQKRFVTSEDVAIAVKFLIDTSSVNGQAITLCGGETV